MLRALGSKKDLLTSDYFELVQDLISSEYVLQMKNFIQHGNTTIFQHCLNVSYYNYKLCKFFKLNIRAGARAGLLHDLFLYDWHYYKKVPGERLHGFEHPKKALTNANLYYNLDKREQDMILKHMFPLTFSIPKYRETLIIVLVDKYCGTLEIFANLYINFVSTIKKSFNFLFNKRSQIK